MRITLQRVGVSDPACHTHTHTCARAHTHRNACSHIHMLTHSHTHARILITMASSMLPLTSVRISVPAWTPAYLPPDRAAWPCWPQFLLGILLLSYVRCPAVLPGTYAKLPSLKSPPGLGLLTSITLPLQLLSGTESAALCQ